MKKIQTQTRERVSTLLFETIQSLNEISNDVLFSSEFTKQTDREQTDTILLLNRINVMVSKLQQEVL